MGGCSKDRLGGDELYRVLTLNTFLLDTPDITIGPSCESDCARRAESICDVLSDRYNPLPDLLLFQEVFEADACASLASCLSGLGYNYTSPCLEGDLNWENPCLVESSKSSGLFLASKTEIKGYNFQSFDVCNGCVLRGSDCQANKGFQYAEQALDDNRKLHIVNTHLDSGSGNRDVEAREAQSIQILDFLSNVQIDDCSIVIIGGDLNTEELTELENFTSSIDVRSANTSIGTSLSGKVLDHILLSTVTTSEIINFQISQTCDPECSNWFESDHFALEASFKLVCN